MRLTAQLGLRPDLHVVSREERVRSRQRMLPPPLRDEAPRAWTLLSALCTPALAGVLARVLDRPPDLVAERWPDLLQRRPPYVAFACGWHYVQARARLDPAPELIAAPVLADARYQDRPRYFSELVVRADAPYETIEDLRDACCAFNEEISFSGCILPAAWLTRRGWSRLPFARLVKTGSHARSLELILQGRVDAAPVDSWVLDMARRAHPEVASRLRVLERFGPAPPPPVFGRGLGRTHATLTTRLSSLSDSADGRELLAAAGLARFVPTCDADYEPLRRAIVDAKRLSWTTRDGRPPELA